MAKVTHKDFLVVRYFFIELQENNHFINPGDRISMKQADDTQTKLADQIANAGGHFEDSDYVSIFRNSQDEDERDGMRLNKKMFEDNSSTNSDSIGKFADLVEKDIDQLIRNDSRTPKILK